MVAPAARYANSTILSKTCVRGRIDRVTSLSEKGMMRRVALTLEAKLPCVSITPFGSPVVPEVYRMLARSSGTTRDRAASKRRGSPRCASSPARRSSVQGAARGGRPHAGGANPDLGPGGGGSGKNRRDFLHPAAGRDPT